MEENPSKKIDSQQARLRKLEQEATAEEKAEKLQQKLAENRATFFGSVDSAQNELANAKNRLTDPNNKKSLDVYEQEIRGFLRSAAQTGESILKVSKEEEEPGGYENLSRQARNINESIAQLRQAIPFYVAVEKADKYYNDVAKKNVEKLQELKENQKIGPVEKRNKLLKTADTAIDNLAVAKKELKQAPAGIGEIYSAIYNEVLEPINDDLEEASKIKEYYAVREFANSEKYKQYLIFDEEEGTVETTEAFDKLQSEDQMRIMMELNAIRFKIQEEIDRKCAVGDAEIAFYEARTFYRMGRPLAAKPMLVNFVKEAAENPRAAEQLAEAKDLLFQILRGELAEANQRLARLRESVEMAQTSYGGNLEMGINKLSAQMFVEDMDAVMQKAEQMAGSGEYLTIEDLRKDLVELARLESAKKHEGSMHRFYLGFQTQGGRYNLIFDVLRTQAELNNESDPEKIKERALEEAKKASDLGLYELAKYYYDIYYSKEINEKKTQLNRAEFINQMRSNPDIVNDLDSRVKDIIEGFRKSFKSEQEKEFEQSYKKKHGKLPHEDGVLLPDYSITADQAKEMIGYAETRERVFQMIAGKAYQKALKLMVHKDMEGVNTDRANKWNELYGNSFVNLEWLEERNWWEIWKMDEAEWYGMKANIIWELVAMGLGAGMAKRLTTPAMNRALRGAMLKRLTSRAVSKELREKALKFAREQAVKKGMIPPSKTQLRGLMADFLIQQERAKGALAFSKFATKELGPARAAALGAGSVTVESSMITTFSMGMQGVAQGDLSIFADPNRMSHAMWNAAFYSAAGKVTNLALAGWNPARGTLASVAKAPAEIVLDETFMNLLEYGVRTGTGEHMSNAKVREMVRGNLVYAVGPRALGIFTRPVERAKTALTRRKKPEKYSPYRRGVTSFEGETEPTIVKSKEKKPSKRPTAKPETYEHEPPKKSAELPPDLQRLTELPDESQKYNFPSQLLSLGRHLRAALKLPRRERAERLAQIIGAIDVERVDLNEAQKAFAKSGQKIRKIIAGNNPKEIEKLTPPELKKLRDTIIALKKLEFATRRSEAREKARLISQIGVRAEQLLHKLYTKSRAGRAPTYEDFRRELDLENSPALKKANLSETELERLNIVVDGLFDKAQLIKFYSEVYSNKAEELFTQTFGYEPLGKVIIKGTAAQLVFECHDNRDYNRITTGDPEVSSGGTGEALPYGESRISELDGFIVVSRQTASPRLLQHEGMHNINKYIFRALDPKFRGYEVPLDLNGKNKAEISTELKDHLASAGEVSLNLAKDEILAFRTDGSDYSLIRDKLLHHTKSRLYDFMNMEVRYMLDSLKATGHFEEKLWDDVIAQYRETRKTYYEKLARAIDAAEKIDDVYFLAVTDVNHWSQIARSAAPEPVKARLPLADTDIELAPLPKREEKKPSEITDESPDILDTVVGETPESVKKKAKETDIDYEDLILYGGRAGYGKYKRHLIEGRIPDEVVEKTREAYESREGLYAEGNKLHSLAYDNPDFKKEVKSKLESPGKETELGQLLEGFKERDPEGYEILKENIDAPEMSLDMVASILDGNHWEAVDSDGNKIKAYEERRLGKGGMANVYFCGYTVNGGTKMKFGAAKLAQNTPSGRKLFSEEVESAELPQRWNHPNINKAIHRSDHIIIYETGPKPRTLHEAVETLPPKQVLELFSQAISGVIEYQNQGYTHRDLKPANIITFEQPDGTRVAQLIDNNPHQTSVALPEQHFGTQGYSPFFQNTGEGVSVSERISPFFAISVSVHVAENPASRFYFIDNFSVARTGLDLISRMENLPKEHKDKLENLFNRYSTTDIQPTDLPAHFSEAGSFDSLSRLKAEYDAIVNTVPDNTPSNIEGLPKPPSGTVPADFFEKNDTGDTDPDSPPQ